MTLKSKMFNLFYLPLISDSFSTSEDHIGAAKNRFTVSSQISNKSCRSLCYTFIWLNLSHHFANILRITLKIIWFWTKMSPIPFPTLFNSTVMRPVKSWSHQGLVHKEGLPAAFKCNQRILEEAGRYRKYTELEKKICLINTKIFSKHFIWREEIRLFALGTTQGYRTRPYNEIPLNDSLSCCFCYPVQMTQYPTKWLNNETLGTFLIFFAGKRVWGFVIVSLGRIMSPGLVIGPFRQIIKRAGGLVI